MSGHLVRFVSSDGLSFEVSSLIGESALQAVRRADPSAIDAPCGGAGTCGKCRVRVVSGDSGAPDADELRRLGPAAAAAGLRLACRLLPRSDLTLAAAGRGKGAAAIRESFSALRGTPDPRVRERGSFGAAVDIGTTTIAVYLVEFAPEDGSSARVVSSASVLNRQRAYGADVIARIDYASRGRDALDELASLVRADIRSLVDRLLSDAGARAEALRELSVVGNTTMLHLFAAVDPAGIAVAPFVPAFVESRRAPAAAFGLPYSRAELFLGPSIAGYVGADLVAASRAAELDQRERPCLVLDLGTNGEMALGDRSGILCCATAAGPAFEGAAISCGLGGVAGAVDGLSWREDGRLSFSTIGGEPPIGVCGSGIIDAAACLVRGRLADDSGALDERWSAEGYPIAAGPSGALRFTQADVRQIQLAKAAVAAGIAALFRERGIGCADVEEVCLAGGFGSYLDPESAAVIGLLPAELLPKVTAVGNAAGHGAVRMLLFRDEAERMERFARSARYLELSTSGFFSERFIEELFFPAADAVLPAVEPCPEASP